MQWWIVSWVLRRLNDASAGPLPDTQTRLLCPSTLGIVVCTVLSLCVLLAACFYQALLLHSCITRREYFRVNGYHHGILYVQSVPSWKTSVKVSYML